MVDMLVPTSSFLLDPRQQVDDVGEDGGKCRRRAGGDVTEAHDAILQPLVAPLADQRTSRVARARALATHRAGADHVRRQLVAPNGVARREGDDVDHDLSQHAVVARVCARKQRNRRRNGNNNNNHHHHICTAL